MAIILPHRRYELPGLERALLKDQSTVMIHTGMDRSYLDSCLNGKVYFVAQAKRAIRTRNVAYFRHCWGQARYWTNQHEAYLEFFCNKMQNGA